MPMQTPSAGGDLPQRAPSSKRPRDRRSDPSPPAASPAGPSLPRSHEPAPRAGGPQAAGSNVSAGMWEVAKQLAELSTNIMLAQSAEEKFKELDLLCREFSDEANAAGAAAARRRDLAAHLRDERVRGAQDALWKVPAALTLAVQEVLRPLQQQQAPRAADEKLRRQVGELSAELSSVRSELETAKREAKRRADDCVAAAEAAKTEAARRLYEVERKAGEAAADNVARARETLERQVAAVRAELLAAEERRIPQAVASSVRGELEGALAGAPAREQIAREAEAAAARWVAESWHKTPTGKASADQGQKLADVDAAVRRHDARAAKLEEDVGALKALARDLAAKNAEADKLGPCPEASKLQAQLQTLQQAVNEISQSRILRSKTFGERLEKWMNRMANDTQNLLAEVRQIKAHVGLEEGEVPEAGGNLTARHVVGQAKAKDG